MISIKNSLNKIHSTPHFIGNEITKASEYFCSKWLGYYWDFCHKNYHNPFVLASLPLFLGKLQKKIQSIQQQNQARFAIGLLYDTKTASLSQQKIAPVKSLSYQIQDVTE